MIKLKFIILFFAIIGVQSFSRQRAIKPQKVQYVLQTDNPRNPRPTKKSQDGISDLTLLGAARSFIPNGDAISTGSVTKTEGEDLDNDDRFATRVKNKNKNKFRGNKKRPTKPKKPIIDIVQQKENKEPDNLYNLNGVKFIFLGFYTLTYADGISRRVYYVADKTGFHAKITTNEQIGKVSNPADVEIEQTDPLESRRKTSTKASLGSLRPLNSRKTSVSTDSVNSDSNFGDI